MDKKDLRGVTMPSTVALRTSMNVVPTPASIAPRANGASPSRWPLPTSIISSVPKEPMVAPAAKNARVVMMRMVCGLLTPNANSVATEASRWAANR